MEIKSPDYKKLLVIVAMTTGILIIPFITSLSANKAQGYFYAALRYTMLIESGSIELNNENINKILFYLDKALSIKETHPQSNYLKAHILISYYKTKGKQALLYIKKTLKDAPKSAIVNIKTALIYHKLSLNQNEQIKKDNLDKALKHTKLAIEYSATKEEEIEYKSRLAQIYIELENYPEAIKSFENTLKKYPDSPTLNNNYAWFLASSKEIKNPEKALIYAKRAINLSAKDNPNILDTLATVYFELGQYQKAIEIEKEAYRIVKSNKEKDIFKKKIELFEEKLRKKN